MCSHYIIIKSVEISRKCYILTTVTLFDFFSFYSLDFIGYIVFRFYSIKYSWLNSMQRITSSLIRYGLDGLTLNFDFRYRCYFPLRNCAKFRGIKCRVFLFNIPSVHLLFAHFSNALILKIYPDRQGVKSIYTFEDSLQNENCSINIVKGILSGLITVSKVLGNNQEDRERTLDDDMYDYNKTLLNLSL